MTRFIKKWREESLFVVIQLSLLAAIFVVAINDAITTDEIGFTHLIILLFLLLLFGGVINLRRRRRFLRQIAEITDLEKRLNESLRTIIDLDAQTRREIAEWMHGEIQHSILRIGRIMEQGDTSGATAELNNLNEKIARGGAQKLFPMQLHVSISLALTDLCAGRAELTIPKELSFERYRTTDGMILPFDVRLAIFRIVQEGLNNAEKKGTATEIKVSLEIIGKSILVTVADNGHALSDNYSPSFGIALIDAYTRAHEGSWDLANTPDGVSLTAFFVNALQPMLVEIPASIQELKSAL